MHRRIMPLFNGLICATLLSGMPITAALAATGSCAALGPLPAVLEVGEGLQQEVQSPVAITRIAVGDPKIADVRVNGNQAFLLTGMGAGATSLMVWTACASAPRQSMVFVQGRATAAMTSARQSPSDDGLLPSQVQTDIRFVEVSRTKLKEASTSIYGKNSNFLFGSPGTVPNTAVTPRVFPLRNLDPRIAVPSIPLANDMFNIVAGGGNFLAIINAMESSGFAYTLARPSLVAISGQSASFLAGGEIPIPIPSANSNSYSIEYKEFGIRLTLTPTVVSNDQIALKVAPEVSELDYHNAVTIGGTTVPAHRYQHLPGRWRKLRHQRPDQHAKHLAGGQVSGAGRYPDSRRVLSQLFDQSRRTRVADDRHAASGAAAGGQCATAVAAG